MYGRRRGGMLGTILFVVIGLSLALAICRVFNYDPFGIIDWLINGFTYTINHLTDLIYNSAPFKAIFRK
mgnify:FL=1